MMGREGGGGGPFFFVPADAGGAEVVAVEVGAVAEISVPSIPWDIEIRIGTEGNVRLCIDELRFRRRFRGPAVTASALRTPMAQLLELAILDAAVVYRVPGLDDPAGATGVVLATGIPAGAEPVERAVTDGEIARFTRRTPMKVRRPRTRSSDVPTARKMEALRIFEEEQAEGGDVYTRVAARMGYGRSTVARYVKAARQMLDEDGR